MTNIKNTITGQPEDDEAGIVAEVITFLKFYFFDLINKLVY